MNTEKNRNEGVAGNTPPFASPLAVARSSDDGRTSAALTNAPAHEAIDEVEFLRFQIYAAQKRLRELGTDATDEISALRKVAEYAARMPDDDNMPEWAKELRHHARAAIAKATKA